MICRRDVGRSSLYLYLSPNIICTTAQRQPYDPVLQSQRAAMAEANADWWRLPSIGLLLVLLFLQAVSLMGNPMKSNRFEKSHSRTSGHHSSNRSTASQTWFRIKSPAWPLPTNPLTSAPLHHFLATLIFLLFYTLGFWFVYSDHLHSHSFPPSSTLIHQCLDHFRCPLLHSLGPDTIFHSGLNVNVVLRACALWEAVTHRNHWSRCPVPQGTLLAFPPTNQALITFKGLNISHLLLCFYSVTGWGRNSREVGRSQYLIVHVLQLSLINRWNTKSVAGWKQRRRLRVELSDQDARIGKIERLWHETKIQLHRELSLLICGKMTERCCFVHWLSENYSSVTLRGKIIHWPV